MTEMNRAVAEMKPASPRPEDRCFLPLPAERSTLPSSTPKKAPLDTPPHPDLTQALIRPLLHS